MMLIQLYKVLFILVLISTTVSAKSIKPLNNKNENLVKLVVESEDGNKIRDYYSLDSDGLTFSYNQFSKSGYKKGDEISLQIMSRTYLASNSNTRKKYQFELIITNDNGEFKRDLTFNKKASSVVSQTEKKGFYFTHAGYWFDNIKLTKKTKIQLIPKIKGQKIYIRLLAQQNDEIQKSESKIHPVDYQADISIGFLNSESEIKKTSNWYVVNKDNKQQFKIDANSLVRVYTRAILEEEGVGDSYNLVVHENNRWIGNYLFDSSSSENEARIVTDYQSYKEKNLSKYSSFYISVPEMKNKNYSYYTFSIPDNLHSVLIKLVEYENK